VTKSKECKETDRQIPEEACRHRGKERKEVPGISAASEEDLGFMPGVSATSEEEEDPGSMPGISAASEEEELGSMPEVSAATGEEGGGPRFHTGICNGATTEEEGEGPGSILRIFNPQKSAVDIID
jgi:hypothetical protein